MKYQVIARKYRPQRFSDVVGQEHITTTLKNALASGRLHHAYLFTGARGIGKTTIARILAKAMNCTAIKDFEPCGKCPSCVEITNGSSLDVQEIDGASNTSVEDVREIRERVRFMPSSAKYKIYIIDEVHMLSTSAFNALLKTLEEPPAHVIFIFATTESHKIPATILSRCQRYDFRRIPNALISSTLVNIAKSEGVAIDEDAIALIAHEATGSLRDAESLFDQAIAFSGEGVTAAKITEMLGTLDRGRLFELVSSVTGRDVDKALEILDGAFTAGADLVRFAFDVLEVFRHMLVIAECKDGKTGIDLPKDEIKKLREFCKDVQVEKLHRLFSLWYDTAESIARSSFPKMLFEVGIMRLCRVDDVKRIEDVIARLDGLSPTDKPGSGPMDKRSSYNEPQSRPAPAVSVDKTSKPDAPMTLSFEPAAVPPDPAAEKKWQEFLRWLVVKKPQVASIMQNGNFEGMDGDVVRLSFSNPLYADMLAEDARRSQVDELLKSFFGRAVKIEMGKGEENNVVGDEVKRKKDLMREALGSDMVKQAADLLNAKLYDVKVDKGGD